MLKSLMLLSAATSIALAAPAFAKEKTAASVETKVVKEDDGGYTKTVKKKTLDATGTTVTDTTKTKVKVDNQGNTEKTVEVEHSTDPKGLLNKTTVKSKNVVKEESGDGSYEKTVEQKNTDAAGTKTATSSKTEVEVNNDGTVEKRTTAEASTDPKGLMNKSSVETTDAVKEGNGTTEVEHNKKVDGETVEKFKMKTNP
jgi:hypothetical protein